jgi:RNA-directed DNA polymerase
VGGVSTPLLANIYLHRLDRAWQTREHGVLVRYADDVVVMCRSRKQAEAALDRLTVLLAELGLEPKAAKTRIVHLAEGEEGFDFLGFHHRLVRGRTPRSAHLTFLARWPARKAVQRARDRIREITDRKRLLVPVEDIVRDLNLFLRGWAGYFRYGNSARVLGQIRNYALRRVALLLSKTGKRRRAWDWGMRQVLRSPDHLGLISLDGAVVSPRPFRDWRAERRR